MMTNLSPSAPTSFASPVMDWAEALDYLLEGKKLSRLAWGNSDTYIQLTDDNHLRIHKPETKQLHDLIVTRGDLEATDWVIV